MFALNQSCDGSCSTSYAIVDRFSICVLYSAGPVTIFFEDIRYTKRRSIDLSRALTTSIVSHKLQLLTKFIARHQYATGDWGILSSFTDDLKYSQRFIIVINIEMEITWCKLDTYSLLPQCQVDKLFVSSFDESVSSAHARLLRLFWLCLFYMLKLKMRSNESICEQNIIQLIFVIIFNNKRLVFISNRIVTCTSMDGCCFNLPVILPLKIGNHFVFVIQAITKYHFNHLTSPNYKRTEQKQIKTRISRFSAYALAIFTEYTAWVAFGGMSTGKHVLFVYPLPTHIPRFVTVAHTEHWIFAFLLSANQNRYADEVLNMYIQWPQTTWVVLLPTTTTHIPSFVLVAHTEL